MKKTVLFAAALLISLFGLSQKEYTIKAKIEGNTNKVAYLASYSGKNLFYYDTTDVKSDGSFTFKNTDMPHGVYAIIVSMPPSTLYFDILVNETNIDLRAKMPDPVSTMNIRKSEENKIFFNYIGYLKKQSEKKPAAIFQPVDADHLLKGICYQSARGLGRTVPQNLISMIEYRFSGRMEKDIADALLLNVIKQWPSFSNSSAENLRGSFIIRDGILTFNGKEWKLRVETKSYDILLGKLPWGYSMIRLSWIPYIIKVEWN